MTYLTSSAMAPTVFSIGTFSSTLIDISQSDTILLVNLRDPSPLTDVGRKDRLNQHQAA